MAKYSGDWSLALVPLPPIHLGPIALERLRVEWELEGTSAGAAEVLFNRFRRHFQRGGGCRQPYRFKCSARNVSMAS